MPNERQEVKKAILIYFCVFFEYKNALLLKSDKIK
jgi:hypothetical protein